MQLHPIQSPLVSGESVPTSQRLNHNSAAATTRTLPFAHYQLSTLHYPLSTINYQLSTTFCTYGTGMKDSLPSATNILPLRGSNEKPPVNGQPTTANFPLPTLHYPLSTINYILYLRHRAKNFLLYATDILPLRGSSTMTIDH